VDSDVSEVPTAFTFYSENRGSKLLRNGPPTVHSAIPRKTVLVMSPENVATTVSTN
jgi:hypothetical protein